MSFKIPSWRLITAGIVAIVADVLQWVLLPLGTPLGLFDPDAVDQILDIVVAGIMVSLLGFHWVFVPSALGKLVPVVDMMPFWTGAVFFVSLGQDRAATIMPNPLEQTALPLNAIGKQPAVLSAPATNPAQPIESKDIHWIKP